MIRRNPMPEPRDIIVKGAQSLGIPLDNRAVDRMMLHLTLLMEWGKKKNLTAIRDPKEIAIRHFLDSLTVLNVIPEGNPLTMLDIGSGAGFPGVVIRTARAAFQLTLLDRDVYRIVFLKHLVGKLGIEGVRFLNSTLEALPNDPNFPRFDIIVSRAYSSDPIFWDDLIPLVNPGGSIIRMAGPSFDEAGFVLRNFRLTARWSGELPFSDYSRTVLRYERRERPMN